MLLNCNYILLSGGSIDRNQMLTSREETKENEDSEKKSVVNF